MTTLEQVKEIANAVLYEGYLLYPYRHTAIKNRQRWTFGVVYPREYSEANGGIEPWTMRTECLVMGQPHTSLDVYVRFLHLLVRTVASPGTSNTSTDATAETLGDSEWNLAALMANEPREEGIERELSALNLALCELTSRPHRIEIAFPAERLVEQASEANDGAETIRELQAITGAVVIMAEAIATDLYKLTVQIENTTPGTAVVSNRHNLVFRQSFVSTHTILRVERGSFLSMIDPPQEAHSHAQRCQNARTWPVLVGEEGEHDSLLSSPIILYDYPRIAPESPGALFDGSEIDEILTLRILTLTDEEKAQMREDARAREILERTESLSPEQFMKLHGVIREMRPIIEGGDA